MKELDTDDPAAIRAAGAIDLPHAAALPQLLVQLVARPVRLGISSNAAGYFATGIKGRPDEANYEDHAASDAVRPLDMPDGKGGVTAESMPMRNAMNEVMRGAYVQDCEIGVKRWNRLIEKAGYTTTLRLPSPRFRRSIGAWAGVPVDPAGRHHRSRRVGARGKPNGCRRRATAPSSRA